MRLFKCWLTKFEITLFIRGGSRGRQISRATEVKIAYLKKFYSSYLQWPVDRVTKILNRTGIVQFHAAAELRQSNVSQSRTAVLRMKVDGFGG